MNPDGDTLLKIGLALSFAANVVAAWRALLGKPNKTEVTPSPLSVVPGVQHPTLSEYEKDKKALEQRIEAQAARLDKLDSRFNEMEKHILAEGERRASRLHERLDEIMENVGRVAERVAELSGEVRSIKGGRA